jgi:hypothetical protein
MVIVRLAGRPGGGLESVDDPRVQWRRREAPARSRLGRIPRRELLRRGRGAA